MQNKKKIYRSVSHLALLPLVALPTAAWATEVPAAQADAGNAGQIEEIVVTAQKRSENLQKAPLAVDVVTPGDLEDRGITNAVDLQEIIPTVKFSAATVMTVSIRGLGTTNLNAGVDAAVAYSQDGFYLSRPNALSPLLYDIKRVEAVLGPQGTLYGRNSNAGVVNFITNDPSTGGFWAAARLQVGNYDQLAGDAVINLPLGDKAALRISGAAERRDGYSKDGSNDQNAYAGRIKLLLEPIESLRIILAVDGAYRNIYGNTYGATCSPGTDVIAFPGCVGVTYKPWEGLLPAATLQFNRNKQFGGSATVDYDMGWASITSLTGYRWFDFEGRTAPPGDNFNYHAFEESKFFTQELRLISGSESAVKWVVGGYYSREDSPANTIFTYGPNTPFPGAPGDVISVPVTKGKYSSFAVFGDITVPVSDQLRLRGGLRYTTETKETLGRFIDQGIAVDIPAGGTFKSNKLTWKAGLDFDITPDNLFYATVSNGFKSGGANLLPPDLGLLTYQPEEITAKEVGLKNRFMDGKLILNLSAFHYAYNNYQTFTFFVTPPSYRVPFVTLFPTLNSQKATFYGGELNVTARISPNDTFELYANWLHDRFDNFTYTTGLLGTVDNSGKKVPNAPDIRFGGSFEHVFALGNARTLTMNLNTEITGPFFADVSNVLASRNPTRTRSGASLSYNETNTGWSVTAFVRNIENKAVINQWAPAYPDPFSTDAGRNNVMLDPPRTYGISVRREF